MKQFALLFVFGISATLTPISTYAANTKTERRAKHEIKRLEKERKTLSNKPKDALTHLQYLCQQAKWYRKLPQKPTYERFYQSVLAQYRTIVKRQPSVGKAKKWRNCAAGAQYEVGMFRYTEMLASPIDSRDIRMQMRQVKRKLRAYTKAQKALQQVMKYRSLSWIVCALTRTAAGKQHVATAIWHAPQPAIKQQKWTQEMQNKYKQLVFMKFVYPLQHSARNMYKKAKQAAEKHKYTGRCYQESKQYLQRPAPIQDKN